MIGYCFGGVLSLLYGSIFHDGPMKNLICFTTPIDFREMKLFYEFFRPRAISTSIGWSTASATCRPK